MSGISPYFLILENFKKLVKFLIVNWLTSYTHSRPSLDSYFTQCNLSNCTHTEYI